ncbi:MAG: CoA pyrophosphatase [Chloroflexi bacterium]|nr:CoA pyrophosphatase [Chloroflexota bacterium]
MDIPIDQLTESEIFSRLSNPTIDQPSEITLEALLKIYSDPPREAAVLIPMFRKEASWHVLFIHRTEDTKEHSGQVAFPGGRLEFQSESVYSAALRETEEEIGIEPEKVKILQSLNPIFTISNYHVTPVVGIIPFPYHFKIQAQEVKHIFTIPLKWLSNRNNWKINTRYFAPLNKELPVIYYQKYHGELLWGVSARIMVNFIQQLTQ